MKYDSKELQGLLPLKYEVIQDNYESSWADYSLTYRIELDHDDCFRLMDYISDEVTWKEIPSEGKWKFEKTVDGTNYQISFIPMECEIYYYENHM